jgi:hypothetical protein
MVAKKAVEPRKAPVQLSFGKESIWISGNVVPAAGFMILPKVMRKMA